MRLVGEGCSEDSASGYHFFRGGPNWHSHQQAGSVTREAQQAMDFGLRVPASATIGFMEGNAVGLLTDEARQDARLDACRKARLRVLMRGGRLHMPRGSGSVAASLGITLQALTHDVERALLREDARLRREGANRSHDAG